MRMLLLIVGIWYAPLAAAQPAGTWEAGLRLQKAIGLYHENGLDIRFAPEKSRWAFTVAWYSSRLGTAYESNAIPQDNFLLQTDFSLFKPKKNGFNIDVGLNTGYFQSDYGSDQFSMLDQNSLLLGFEISPRFTFGNFALDTGFGYHIIHGTGVSGPGTLYPFYVQAGLKYRIKS